MADKPAVPDLLSSSKQKLPNLTDVELVEQQQRPAARDFEEIGTREIFFGTGARSAIAFSS